MAQTAFKRWTTTLSFGALLELPTAQMTRKLSTRVFKQRSAEALTMPCSSGASSETRPAKNGRNAKPRSAFYRSIAILLRCLATCLVLHRS